MVAKGVEHIAAEEKQVGGQLGRPSGARFRTYERLKRHAEKVKNTLFDLPELGKAIEEIDKTIDHLNKVKENLLKSDNNLRLANNKASELSIKRLGAS